MRAVDAAFAPVPAERPPVPALAQLPYFLDGWQAKDEPLSPALLQAAGVDAHLHRRYASPTACVTLFIGYGTAARDMVAHRPEVCYPGAGWRIESHRAAEVRLRDGSTLPCTIFRFSRSGFDGREVTVLNYYRIDGQTYPDVSYLRTNAWAPGRIRSVSQVQIACSSASTSDAEQQVREFAVHAAARIQGLLPGNAHQAR